MRKRIDFIKKISLGLAGLAIFGSAKKIFADTKRVQDGSTQYTGEICMFAGNFAPAGWAFCNGLLLSTSEYNALFSLIGTTYGGDGYSTFAVPDLRGRAPMHVGPSYLLASKGGVETVVLSTSNLPSHNHSLNAVSDIGNSTSPQNSVIAYNNEGSLNLSTATPNTVMKTGVVSTYNGGGQYHNNVQPYIAINYIICLEGEYPVQP